MTRPVIAQRMTVMNQDVQVVAIPSDCEFGTVTIVLANTGAESADCRIYIGTGDAVELKMIIDAKAIIAAGGGQTFSCITVGPGEKIWVRATTGNVAVQVRGLVD